MRHVAPAAAIDRTHLVGAASRGTNPFYGLLIMESGMDTQTPHRSTFSSITVLLSGLLAMSGSVAQNEDNFTLSGSLEAGAEYSSNVSVSELETASGSGDTAGILDAGLDLNWQATDRLTVDAGYSFSGSRYRTVDAFDMDMHLLYADVGYDFDALTVGTSYYYANADLGSQSFLRLHQYSLYAGSLVTDTWYLRGAVNFADKTFPGLSARDADTEGVSIDSFWFFGQGSSTLSAGYAFDDETARAPQFSYRAHTIRLRYSNRFLLSTRESRFQAGVRFQDREYRGVTPDVGRRDDSQLVADASLEVHVLDALAVIGRLEAGNYRSNLDSADYRDNRISVAVRYSFQTR